MNYKEKYYQLLANPEVARVVGNGRPYHLPTVADSRRVRYLEGRISRFSELVKALESDKEQLVDENTRLHRQVNKMLLARVHAAGLPTINSMKTRMDYLDRELREARQELAFFRASPEYRLLELRMHQK